MPPLQWLKTDCKIVRAVRTLFVEWRSDGTGANAVQEVLTPLPVNNSVKRHFSSWSQRVEKPMKLIPIGEITHG